MNQKMNQINLVKSLTAEEKNRILKEYKEISGYGSMETIKFLMNKKYHWSKIYREMENCVKVCKSCLKSGEAKINSKSRVIIASKTNELWLCDLIGRIPGKTKKTSSYS